MSQLLQLSTLLVAILANEICNVTVQSEIAVAKRQINECNERIGSQWSLKQKLALSARILAFDNQGVTLSGQISCRDPNNKDHMWSTPYHLSFENLTPEDFILLDFDLNMKGGKHFPNRATRFHGHMYKVREEVNCIVHTHPPYTSVLSIIDQSLLIRHMDTMAFYDDVQFHGHWPGIPFGDEEGELLESILDKNGTLYYSALLAHHGLFVMGKHIEEAVYRAFFFELGAKMIIRALSAVNGNDKYIHGVDETLAAEAARWRVSDSPVKAHFNNWAMMVLKKYENIDLVEIFKKENAQEI